MQIPPPPPNLLSGELINTMHPEDLRSLARDAGVDLCTLIEAAISVAAADCGDELRARRDGMVELLYTPPAPPPQRCLKCEEAKGSSSPVVTPQSMNRVEAAVAVAEEEVEDDDVASDPTNRILAFRKLLDDEDQSDEQLVSLLQDLADVDVTFESLKETDIGRHVSKFRKHPSTEVQRLVKLIVRKWKGFVDNWVKNNTPDDNTSPANNTDGDSPMQAHGNGHRAPDFGYSPNPHNGNVEHAENKAKAAAVVARREHAVPTPKMSQATPPVVPRPVQKEALMDPEKLASARKRLQDNYQEAQNAKKQRTIQVMDIHEIPKQKAGRGRGGSSHQQSKHW